MTLEPTTDTKTSDFSQPAPPPPSGTHDDDPPHKTHRSQSKQRSSGNNSKRKPQTKNKKKKQPYRPAYLDAIQQEIDDLKEQDPQGGKEESTLAMINKLEELKLKLSTPEMLQKSSRERDQYTRSSPEQTNRFEQETLTLLHFFYIVRLAQKGFFYVISQSYPDVEPKALIHLCDRLVGGSLFVVKDPMEQVRSNKRIQVFNLLQKLHEGAPEPIDDGFSTTFKQVRHLVFDFIESTQPSLQYNQLSQYQDQQEGHNDKESSPVWVMVPFHGMVDGIPEGIPVYKNDMQEKKVSPGTSGHLNGSASPKNPSMTETTKHDDTKNGQPNDEVKHTKEPSISEGPTSDHEQQVTGSDDTNEDIPSSWASTLATTPSSSWSQGNADQTTTLDDGWGSPIVDANPSPPEWNGKLPDDLVNPGDETISGDLSFEGFSRPWQDNRRGGPRGRSSGYRGSGRGGPYRTFGDDYRRGRGRGGLQRGGSTNSGWNTRPPRSE